LDYRKAPNAEYAEDAEEILKREWQEQEGVSGAGSFLQLSTLSPDNSFLCVSSASSAYSAMSVKKDSK